MDGVVQSHVVLLVVDGIMMLISVILITNDQKGLRPEHQIQEKEMIFRIRSNNKNKFSDQYL